MSNSVFLVCKVFYPYFCSMYKYIARIPANIWDEKLFILDFFGSPSYASDRIDLEGSISSFTLCKLTSLTTELSGLRKFFVL